MNISKVVVVVVRIVIVMVFPATAAVSINFLVQFAIKQEIMISTIRSINPKAKITKRIHWMDQLFMHSMQSVSTMPTEMCRTQRIVFPMIFQKIYPSAAI